MKKKEISIITKKVINTINKFSDLKIGDCIKEIGLIEETDTPYCKVIDIGDNNIVIKWFRRPEHHNDYEEYCIISDKMLRSGDDYTFIFANKKEIMAWLI